MNNTFVSLDGEGDGEVLKRHMGWLTRIRFNQKNKLFVFTFERGNSQHENIPTNKPLKPSYRAVEIFRLNVPI